jgi:hypothetical protein
MPAMFTYPWIINKRSDLLWLIGPVIFSIATLGLYYFFTKSIDTNVTKTVFIFYLAWTLLFDSSHFFATYTRTYFDKIFYRQNKAILTATWATFLIGPLFIGLPFLFTKDVYLLRNTFTIFNRLCICMAYFHLVRQHWGIIAIYRRRNNETNNNDRRFEHAILLMGCFLPFLHYQYSHEPLVSNSEIMAAFQPQHWHKEVYYLLGWAVVLLLFHLFTQKKWPFLKLHKAALVPLLTACFIYIAELVTLKTLLGWLCSLLFIALVVVVLRYVLRKQNPGKTLQPINVPKWGLLFTVIAAHAIFIELPIPFVLKPVLLGIYHNIQYHRIVHYHNQNKYTGPDKHRYGMAAVFAKRFGILLLFITLFDLIAVGFQWGSRLLVTGEVFNYFIICIAWAIPLHHYILDAVIWRLRKDESLLRHLNCGQTA